MEKHLVFYLSLFFTCGAWAWGAAPYPNPAWETMTDTTATINQFTTQTDGEGVQDKRWDQEEERQELTDKEREDLNKEKEEDKSKNIDNYRFDVVPKKKGLEY